MDVKILNIVSKNVKNSTGKFTKMIALISKKK